MRLLTRSKSSSRSIVAVAAAALLTVVSGCAWSGPNQSGPGGSGQRAVRATLKDADGGFVGTVRLDPKRDSVVVTGRFKGLTPGFHGFHLHAVGQCEPPFTSAGGHHNPGDVGHGQHDGDLPPLLVQQDGTAVTVTESDLFDVAELRDADGTAVVVHAGPDNLGNIPDRYVSTETGQPGPDDDTIAAGDAGARVACGVLSG